MEPVIASGVAVIFLGEVLGIRGIAGAAIMLTGVLTSEIGGYVFHRK
jgi:drug/metabolite transporter (DMT)-like permease